MSFELEHHFQSSFGHDCASVLRIKAMLACQVCNRNLSNSSDCMARLGTNTMEHASKMELYIILATLNAGIAKLLMKLKKMTSSEAKPV